MGRKRYTPEQIISMLREAEVLQIQGSKMADICDQLYDLFICRDTPEHIRSDNAPEFKAKTVRKWVASSRLSMRKEA